MMRAILKKQWKATRACGRRKACILFLEEVCLAQMPYSKLQTAATSSPCSRRRTSTWFSRTHCCLICIPGLSRTCSQKSQNSCSRSQPTTTSPGFSSSSTPKASFLQVRASLLWRARALSASSHQPPPSIRLRRGHGKSTSHCTGPSFSSRALTTETKSSSSWESSWLNGFCTAGTHKTKTGSTQPSSSLPRASTLCSFCEALAPATFS
mmetsp:Transcript_62022/g.146246  ORF Transcript_62022/g.146246 Transcript_62022/m.146246 type:complete len:209 (-) Transcript_62022:98-724(-)